MFYVDTIYKINFAIACFSRNFGAERALVNKEFDEMQFPDI